jgi:hypothetical protein
MEGVMSDEEVKVVDQWLVKMNTLFKGRIGMMGIKVPIEPKDIDELRLAMKTWITLGLEWLDKDEYGAFLEVIECLFFVYHPACRQMMFDGQHAS